MSNWATPMADDIKVLDGLLEGESIVTKGAFVLKSELLGEQI